MMIVPLLLSALLGSALGGSLDYVGCFKDSHSRAMTGLWFDTQGLTLQMCVDICKSLGFQYAGAQYSAHCFCGNEYQKYGPASNCNMGCTGDRSQMCGGGWANSVYRTGASGERTPASKATAVGCFRDAGNRVMTTLWTHAALMTNDICHKTCLAVGSKYSATQYSQHCFCGDVYNSLGGAPNCNMRCGGDASQMCGGAWANQVYEISKVVTKPPTEAPTPAPTKAPTEAPETCPKQRAQFAENNIPVEPTLSQDCKFDEKQCNDEKCWCVKAGSGALNYDGVVVPASESFDCSRKPRKCEKKRFGLILKGKGGVPTCSKSGKYEEKQCNSVECWCVKPKSGKERKNTRTSSGNLKC